MKRVYGWAGGRAGVRYIITKFSQRDSLPNFLTHGAPLCARFARARSSANSPWKESVAGKKIIRGVRGDLKSRIAATGYLYGLLTTQDLNCAQ